METLNNRGQSTIEYVLLLAVIALLVTTIVRNDAFQDYLGPDGELFQSYAGYVGYSYRHGTQGSYLTQPNLQEDYLGDHDTYNNRFRIPLELYPENGAP